MEALATKVPRRFPSPLLEVDSLRLRTYQGRSVLTALATFEEGLLRPNCTTTRLSKLGLGNIAFFHLAEILCNMTGLDLGPPQTRAIFSRGDPRNATLRVALVLRHALHLAEPGRIADDRCAHSVRDVRSFSTFARA